MPDPGPLPVSAPIEHGCMGERRWRPSKPWDSGPITNGLGASVPEHVLSPPVPIVARVVWAVDGRSASTRWHSAGPARPSTFASPTHVAGPTRAGWTVPTCSAGDDAGSKS
jgi:hypothetical protein